MLCIGTFLYSQLCQLCVLWCVSNVSCVLSDVSVASSLAGFLLALCRLSACGPRIFSSVVCLVKRSDASHHGERVFSLGWSSRCSCTVCEHVPSLFSSTQPGWWSLVMPFDLWSLHSVSGRAHGGAVMFASMGTSQSLFVRRWVDFGGDVPHVQLVFFVEGLLIGLGCLSAPRMCVSYAS